MLYMYFFGGSVKPQVRRVLKSGVERCTDCGFRADLVQYDNVLRLFLVLVPVWHWKGKEPLVYCNGCKFVHPHQLYSVLPPKKLLPQPQPQLAAMYYASRCQLCDQAMRANFRFCPYCGRKRYLLWDFGFASDCGNRYACKR